MDRFGKCMNTGEHMCTCTCISACTYMFICMCTYMYVCTCMYMYNVFYVMHTCICVHNSAVYTAKCML